jgi:hypothetical protein
MDWHPSDIERYVRHLRDTGRAPSTIRAHVAAVREFHSYLVDPRPAGPTGAGASERFTYADYLLAIGYTQRELENLVSSRPPGRRNEPVRPLGRQRGVLR